MGPPEGERALPPGTDEPGKVPPACGSGAGDGGRYDSCVADVGMDSSGGNWCWPEGIHSTSIKDLYNCMTYCL